MKKLIHTSLSPNTETDDIRLVGRLILSPWKWKRGEAEAGLVEVFKKMLSVRYAFAFDSGRTCLLTLLSAFGVGKGDEVLLQAFTCVAVPAPVLWVGARPVYVDCLKDYTIDLIYLERKITPQTKAIIVQHAFGNSPNMQEVCDIAKRHNLVLIEDCAHALGAEFQGKKLGSFGHAAFFSFGRDKVISSVFGGMLVTNDEALARKIKDLQKTYPYPSRPWILQQLMHPLILSLSKLTYQILGLGKIILELSKRCHLISKAVLPEEKRGERPGFVGKRLANGLACLALHQVQKLDRLNAHRRMLAEQYAQGLGDLPRVDIEPMLPGRIYLRYCIQVPDANRCRTEAHRQGILLGDWYTTPVAPAGVLNDRVGYSSGSCPVAERLAMTTVNLPTHIGISSTQANEVIQIIRKMYAT